MAVPMVHCQPKTPPYEQAQELSLAVLQAFVLTLGVSLNEGVLVWGQEDLVSMQVLALMVKAH